MAQEYRAYRAGVDGLRICQNDNTRRRDNVQHKSARRTGGLLCAVALSSICRQTSRELPLVVRVQSSAKMSAEVENRYRKTLAEAVAAGTGFWREEAKPDAVIAAIVVGGLPLFNAGRGAVYNEGEVELDASIMLGEDLNAGVTGVKKVRNPILLAERIMANSPHVMLMGEGAEAFAKTQQLELVDNEYFNGEASSQLEHAIARDQDLAAWNP